MIYLKIFLTFLLSLTIYFFIFFSFFLVLDKKEEKLKPIKHFTKVSFQSKKNKISLKKKQKVQEEKKKTPILKVKQPIKKTIKKQKKQIIKPSIPVQQPKKIKIKPIVSHIKIDQNKTKIKKEPSKKSKTQQKKTLLEILSQDMNLKEKRQSIDDSPLKKEILSLYGNQFSSLSKTQQNYILDNMEIMRIITQDILQRVAMINLPTNMQIKSYNIVEFYLYPNGNISDFKFLYKSGHSLLEKTTQETIDYAYSKYPHPKEKTLIRYKVFYNLHPY